MDFRGVTEADAGLYTLIISNIYGIAFAPITLVIVPPGPLDKWYWRNCGDRGRA